MSGRYNFFSYLLAKRSVTHSLALVMTATPINLP